MVVYFGQSISVSSAGTYLAHVVCEKCETNYYYELTRIGKSSGYSPYGIAASSIKELSEERSKKELLDRLRHEAELVPCPTCNWINDELVVGFRSGRHRGLGLAAFLVAVLGTFSSLIAAWFVYQGPQADRWCLPYLLIGGPTFSIGCAFVIIALQQSLRLLIRPNRMHPLPPRLPEGTPPALVLDAAQDELVAVRPTETARSGNTEWHEFQIGRDALPEHCCDCLSTASCEPAYDWEHSGFAVRFFRCHQCQRSSRLHYFAIYFVSFLCVSTFAYVSLKISRADADVFWICLISAVLVAFGVAAYLAMSVTVPAKLRMVDSSRGVVKLKFRNPDYSEWYANNSRIGR